jgi:uncharacterized protein (TIGR01244 family)
MTAPKKINDDFAAGGQPTADDFDRLAAAGFQSVVNLRSPEETSVIANEQQLAEATGLHYVNIPLPVTEPAPELTAQVIAAAEHLPTPIYFHCGAGARASAAALIVLATQQGLKREDILARTEELGINPDQPQLKYFLENLS